MATDVFELYALRYATRAALRPEHFIGGDPHDTPMPMDSTVVFHKITAEPADVVLPSVGQWNARDQAKGTSAVDSSPISPAPVSPSQGVDSDVSDDDEVTPEDATIVLPLSNAPSWKNANGGRPTGAKRP